MIIICKECGHKQGRDLVHPKTFDCSNCGAHYNYTVNVVGDIHTIVHNGKRPLPEGERKAAVSVREYPRMKSRLKAAGYSLQEIWNLGVSQALTELEKGI